MHPIKGFHIHPQSSQPILLKEERLSKIGDRTHKEPIEKGSKIKISSISIVRVKLRHLQVNCFASRFPDTQTYPYFFVKI